MSVSSESHLGGEGCTYHVLHLARPGIVELVVWVLRCHLRQLLNSLDLMVNVGFGCIYQRWHCKVLGI